MSFKVSTISAGTITPTTKDGRTDAQKMFYDWNGGADAPAEGEDDARLVALEVVALDCTNGSPGDLGFKGDNALQNCIPYLQNYKGGVDAFKGASKGKTLVIIGGQRGYRSANMMVQRESLRELAEHLIALDNALSAAEAEGAAEDSADDLTGE